MAARQERLIAGALFAAFAAALAWLAAVTPWTVDEPNYLSAGIALRETFDFRIYTTILQGPLPLLANQTFAFTTPVDPIDGYKLAGRLGMLPFAFVAAACCWRLARRLAGPTAGLVALTLIVTDANVLAHGCLMTADMALAAGWTATVLCAWRWLEAPTLARLIVLGTVLGATLATKYLAVLLVPALGVALGVAAVRGARPALWWSRRDDAGCGRRVADALLAAALVGVCAWIALWACYGFRPNGYELRAPPAAAVAPQDPDAGALSTTFRNRVGDAITTTALRALPEPFVRGIDYQIHYAEGGGMTRFRDRVGPGFALYYPTALLTKVSTALLVLLAAAFVVALVPGVRRRGVWPRHAATLIAAAALVPLAYLSLGSTMQMGVRYVLMVVPLLAVVASRAAAGWHATPLGRGLVAAVVVAALAGAVRDGARPLSAFNLPTELATGGRPYLWFTDSNLVWRPAWAPDPDGEVAAARHPDAAVVVARSGPRFGRVRIQADGLGAVDATDASRVHHWLRRFDPIDRIGAWFVFDVRESDFRAAAARDPRARSELALALIAAGRASEAVDLLPADGPTAELAQRIREGRTTDAGWFEALMAAGAVDQVAADAAAPIAIRARATFELGDFHGVATLLAEVERSRPLIEPEALVLAAAHEQNHDLERAVEVLERCAPPTGSPSAALWQRVLDDVRKRRDGIRANRR